MSKIGKYIVLAGGFEVVALIFLALTRSVFWINVVLSVTPIVMILLVYGILTVKVDVPNADELEESN